MRSIHTVFAVVVTTLTLSACGPEQEVFVETYNNLDCAHLLACGDQAELTFDGYLSDDPNFDAQEACETRNLPAVADWGRGCRYQGGVAQECMLAMESRTCPQGGGEADVPAICESVYVECVDATDDTNDTPKDSPADTDAGTDTDVAE